MRIDLGGGLPAPWPLVIRAVGLVVAAVLIVAVVLVARREPPLAQALASDFMGRRYWLVVAAVGAGVNVRHDLE